MNGYDGINATPKALLTQAVQGLAADFTKEDGFYNFITSGVMDDSQKIAVKNKDVKVIFRGDRIFPDPEKGYYVEVSGYVEMFITGGYIAPAKKGP